MELCGPFRHSQGLFSFSPNGKYLASVKLFRVMIRSVDDPESPPVHNFECPDVVDAVEWSCDSGLIMCSIVKRSVVVVFGVSGRPKTILDEDKKEWSCKIDQGAAGLSWACFAPDSRHVLTASDFNLKLTVWSLTSRSVHHMASIKSPKRCLAWSPSGALVAVAERNECRDSLSIITTSNWRIRINIDLGTTDCEAISWSPDDAHIAVRDTNLETTVLVYALDGTEVLRLQPYTNALGARTLSWSPRLGSFFAAGMFNGEVHLINALTFQPIAALQHETPITDPSCIVYAEVEHPSEGYRSFQIQPLPFNLKAKQPGIGVGDEQDVVPKHSKSAAARAAQRSVASASRKSGGSSSQTDDGLFAVDCGRDTNRHTSLGGGYATFGFSAMFDADETEPLPTMGASVVAFDPAGEYLATVEQRFPLCVWIWNLKTLSLCALMKLKQSVRAVAWSPLPPSQSVSEGVEIGGKATPSTRLQPLTSLAVVTGGNCVYFWKSSGATSVELPLFDDGKLLQANRLQWSHDGTKLVAADRAKSALCYVGSDLRTTAVEDGETLAEATAKHQAMHRGEALAA
eukprot:Clim_evm52s214 gene=Clim_evmTU52s214